MMTDKLLQVRKVTPQKKKKNPPKVKIQTPQNVDHDDNGDGC